MIDWNRYHLPPEAARIDRITFRVWKLWHGWFRPTLGLAFRIAGGLAFVFVVGLVVAGSLRLGQWAIAATGVIVLGVLGGFLTHRKPQKEAAPGPTKSWIVAVLLAILLAPVLLLVAFVLEVLMSLVFWIGAFPVVLLVPVVALGMGRLIGRRLTREASRYPPSIP